MPERCFAIAAGAFFIAVAVIDVCRVFRHRRPARGFGAAVLRCAIWGALLVLGVAGVERGTASDEPLFIDSVLRATSAFSGASPPPAAPHEGLVLGVTRLLGRVYIIVSTIMVAATLLGEQAKRTVR